MDFIEEQIRLAQERGDFDNLPGAGKPIEGLGTHPDPQWWVRQFLERMQSADADRQHTADLEKRLARVWTLPAEAAVRDQVEALNAEAGSDLFDADSVVTSWKAFRLSMRDRT